ncbi:hypothetical protein MMC06_001295 [Schaereria dolodes]|nr:hypothetical protein [Schaereria dolodes]
MKPLPPLPERRFCRTRLDPRRDDPAARCILSRVKRMRAQTVPHSQHNTIQQRRNIVPNPYLTLSAPQQRGIPASPMIWLEDEQVWLIADGRGFDEYYGPSYPSPPEYEHIPPPYARSEPSPRQPESENLPIHGQFLSLMDNERDEDRLSPLFQQAIHAFSPFGPHEPDSSDMLSVPETERDWDTETSRQQSWHSATSSISPFTESQPSTGEGKAWETLAMRVIRPSSAMQ